MNDITIFIFGIMFASVVGATFAFMWRMTGAVLEDVRKPQKKMHPEMKEVQDGDCLLYTSPSPRDVEESRMPSSA